MRRLKDDERGVVAVVVAVSFTAILGVAALVLDGGALRDEHAQLQTGVDSAALSLAKKCAYGRMDWCDNAKNIAEMHVDYTADDFTARIVTAEVNKTARTVRLVAGAETEGSPSLPMRFAGVLGHTTADPQAEAVAAWNPLETRPWNPVPIARCIFDEATANGTRFKDAAYLMFDYTGSQSCADGRPAAVPPNTSQKVSADWEFPHGSTVSTDTKCNPNSACDPSNFAPYTQQEIVLSVWSKVGGAWRLDGFTGFKLESMSRNNGHRVGPASRCDKEHDCLSGWFTRTQRPDGQPGYYRLGGEVWLTR